MVFAEAAGQETNVRQKQEADGKRQEQEAGRRMGSTVNDLGNEMFFYCRLPPASFF